jgi:hypothetical protein
LEREPRSRRTLLVVEEKIFQFEKKRFFSYIFEELLITLEIDIISVPSKYLARLYGNLWNAKLFFFSKKK